jgi:outer membrane usher protein
MLKRKCAHNKFVALPITHSGRTVLCEAIFFLTLSIFLLIFLPSNPAFPADEKANAPIPVSASTESAPDKVKTETQAGFSASPKDTTQIIVNIIVNTLSKGDFFLEMDEGKNLFVRLEDVKALNLQYAADRIVIIRGDEQYVPLSALFDVKYTFDERKLTVAIIGKTMETGKTAVDLFSLKPASKQNIYYPRETSAFLNYGLAYAYTSTEGFQSFAVTNKLGFRTGDVFFTSDSLYTKMENSDNFVRLQSSATYERRGDLQWLVFGDQYANSGDLGSTVNMGGIGFSKVYRMDPYFITQPVMDLKGSVIFPTQAEIYLDGVLIGKQPIAPGSFELKNLYSYTGSHNVQVVLKDPFGNVQKIDYMTYFSSQLLRKGLHEYSYNAGVLRENYGMESDQYGKAVFSAFHRYGVTNNFNIGARAEGADGIYNVGISTAFAVPRLGQITLSCAGSSARDNDTGGAISLQHSFQLGSFNTSLLLRGYSRDYLTVGGSLLTDRSQYELNAGMGILLNPLGSFSINYSENAAFSGTDIRVISANYSRSLYRTINMFATASATHTSNDTAKDTNYSCFVGLNFELGKGIRGSAQVSGGSGNVNTETLQLQKDTPIGEGLGYRASLNSTKASSTADRVTSFNPYVQYNAKYGIYSVDATIQNSDGVSSELYNLSAAGALVYAGGFYGLARPVSDSFGIVMVGNVPGATVLSNGQDIGKTGSSGTLVVPTLTSYGRNQITLDTKNIPIDYSISDVNRILSPPLWSGSCIAFDAQQVQSLTGTLVAQKEGKKVPLEYVEISIKAGEKNLTYPTGKGGEFYIENSIATEQKENVVDKKENASDNLSCRAIAEQRKSGGKVVKPGTYPAFVEYEDSRCTFMITFPDTKEPITDIGEIQCGGTNASAPAPVVPPSPSIQAPPAKESLPQRNKLYYEKDEANLRGSPPCIQTPSPPQASETTSAPATLPVPRSISSTSAVEQKQEKVSFILRAQFVKGKSFLDKKHDKYIRKLADFMKAYPETSIEIIGHTDNIGKEGYDILLSQKRANSVRKYLIDKFGIEKSRMHALGYGSNKPIADNNTKEGRRQNNRIEVVIEGL